MTIVNPFTERGRITDPSRFAGRWGELSLLFDRVESGRPVMLTGVPGVGKSSLLTHIMQSAATNLDLPDLHAYYLNLSKAPDAAEVYRVIVAALAHRGDTAAALEVALVAAEGPVLLCLDNAQQAIAADWGTRLLEDLARMARGQRLMLVVALEGQVPLLSERFSTINIGAFAPPDVRLLTEAYLDDTGISFSPAELHSLITLSAAHPAYLQRAAFHLFESKLHPDLDWRAAYLAEARAQPIPGAPLPPEIFEGERSGRMADSTYNEELAGPGAEGPAALPELELNTALLAILPLLAGALFFMVAHNLMLAAVIAIGGLIAVVLAGRRHDRTRERH